jgi:hypothetical protein
MSHCVRLVVIDVQKACSAAETSVTIHGCLDEWKDGMDIRNEWLVDSWGKRWVRNVYGLLVGWMGIS